MSDSPTRVYLMVECEVNGIMNADEQKRIAQGVVQEAIRKDSGNRVGETYSFTLPIVQVLVHDPEILPDDIKKILWRDSVKHIPLHKQLESAVIENGKKPAKQRWQSLINRGVIDDDGNVLM